MKAANIYKTGKLAFALSLFLIGIAHLVFKTFPIGFEPVSKALSSKPFISHSFGALMSLSALLILWAKYSYRGSMLAFILLLIIVFAMHVPKVLQNIGNGSYITGLFEGVALLSGTLMLITINKPLNKTPAITARIIFAVSLIVFAILHIIYAAYITTLIPAWLPSHIFINYLIIFGFFASAISFATGFYIHLAGILLGAVFFIWFLILHLPRAFTHPSVEPEWTSAFIALAMSGVSLLMTYYPTKKAARI